MLVLASASPRRRQLLQYVTDRFSVDVSDTDETLPAGIDPAEAVQLLARRKAQCVAARHSAEDVIIGSDTVVVLDGEILGKPKDPADAREMLRGLAGRTHRVCTGVAVLHGDHECIFCSEADVHFGTMTEQEITDYLATGEAYDKAGAYGIQGFAARYIEGVTGDYYTVMGLPVRRLYQVLRAFGVL